MVRVLKHMRISVIEHSISTVTGLESELTPEHVLKNMKNMIFFAIVVQIFLKSLRNSNFQSILR